MTTDIHQLVTQLRRVGLRPTEEQWQKIKEAGTAAESALLELALDKSSLGKTEPTSLGPIHALRLLGEQSTVENTTIEQLFHVVPMEDLDPASQGPFVWRQDLPQIIGRWGKAAADLARPLAVDTATPPAQRVLALEVLAYAVEIEPSLRDDVVPLLREQLATVDEPYVGAAIVRSLSLLHVGDAYNDVMAAYKRGVVDRELIPPTEARQQLLNPRQRNNLGCVHHTLAERYEQHGPYTEEEQQALAERYRQQQFGG